MGSWNETCAISHMAIEPGDEIVWLLFTCTNELGGVKFSAGDVVAPWTIPIRGEYDDYGRIRILPEDADFLKITQLQTQPSWEHEKLPAGLQPLKWLNRVQEMASDNALKCVSYNGGERGWIFPQPFTEEPDELTDMTGHRHERSVIGLMILKSVWDKVLELELGFGYNGEKISYTEICKEISTYVKPAIDRVAALPRSDASGTRFALMVAQLGSTMFGQRTMFSRLLNGESWPMGVLTLQDLSDQLILAASNGVFSEDEVRVFLERIAEVAFIDFALRATRRIWEPTSGSGSQSVNDKETILLQRQILQAMEAIAAGREGDEL